MVDDTIFEPNETFQIDLVSPSAPRMLGLNSSATVTIIDDDRPPTFQFRTGSYAFMEADESVLVHVEVERLNDRSRYDRVSVSLSGNGTELHLLSPSPAELLFAPDVAFVSVQLSITGDDSEDPHRQYTLSLSSPQPPAVLGPIYNTTVIVVDDD